MEKTGRRHLHHDTTVQDDVPTFWTRMLEPIVAAHYTRNTGRRVRRVKSLVRHPERPWMFAVVDWKVIDNPDVQLLSYIFVGPIGSTHWRRGPPDHIRLQAMHTLAVTGLQAIDLAVLVCGEELQVHRICRDDVVIARLQALEETFWRHVERGEAPPSEGFIDPQVVRKVLCASPGAPSHPHQKTPRRHDVSDSNKELS